MNYENIAERRVLVFGDSNTYGYDPRCYAGDILSPAVRWTGWRMRTAWNGATATIRPVT